MFTCEAFAARQEQGGRDVEVRALGDDAASRWTVTAVKRRVPDYAAIKAFAAELAAAAGPLGGENDGWGGFTLKDI